MKLRCDWQDVLTRCLILVAGTVAGVLLVMHGELAALPGLALGGTLGACFVTRLASENR
jgi:hypothetical protein